MRRKGVPNDSFGLRPSRLQQQRLQSSPLVNSHAELAVTLLRPRRANSERLSLGQVSRQIFGEMDRVAFVA